MNKHSLDLADDLVQEMKRVGWTNMNRSKLIRLAIREFDLKKFFQENTVPSVLDI